MVLFRKNDEGTSPCSTAVSGPRCSYLCQQATVLQGQEGSQDFAGTHHVPMGNQWWLSLHPSIPHGLTLQGHSQPSTATHQLLQCRVTKLGVTGETSLPGI